MRTSKTVPILPIIAVTLMLTPLVSAAEDEKSPLARLDAVEADIDALTQAVEELGDFGCSATQQDNNVLITCGDGTSGVIAGAGTVVLYPEGQIGEVPPIDYNTGPVVAMDASGVVLGQVSSLSGHHINIYIDDRVVGVVLNDPNNQEVRFSGVYGEHLFFLSEDCTGPAFKFGGNGYAEYLAEVDGQYFVAYAQAPSADILFKSRYSVGGWTFGLDPAGSGSEVLYYVEPKDCLAIDEVLSGVRPVVEYFPASEITNAAYPVTVEQLPATN